MIHPDATTYNIQQRKVQNGSINQTKYNVAEQLTLQTFVEMVSLVDGQLQPHSADHQPMTQQQTTIADTYSNSSLHIMSMCQTHNC